MKTSQKAVRFQPTNENQPKSGLPAQKIVRGGRHMPESRNRQWSVKPNGKNALCAVPSQIN